MHILKSVFLVQDFDVIIIKLSPYFRSVSCLQLHRVVHKSKQTFYIRVLYNELSIICLRTWVPFFGKNENENLPQKSVVNRMVILKLSTTVHRIHICVDPNYGRPPGSGSALWETSWIRIRIEDADLNLGVKKTEYLSKEQKVSI